MRRKTLLSLFVLGIVLVSVVASGVALARARGSPELTAHVVDDEVVPGEDLDLEIKLLNSGEVAYATTATEQDRVTTARAVRVTLQPGDAPIEVQSGTQTVGSVPEGVSSAIPFAISVEDDAETGEYTVEVEVEYTYTSVISRDGGYNERTRTRTLETTIVVVDGARFNAVDASADDLYGTSGPVTITIRNDGAAAAHDATVEFESGSPQLTFGDTQTASTFVGEWEPGETRDVTVEGSLAPGADRRTYPLTATVRYEDGDGDAVESEALSVGVTPRVGSRFDLRDVESTLAVGEEGTVTGTVVNEGSSEARNGVLVLSADTRNINPIETEYSLGDLQAGGSADFSFDVEVSEAASGGPRQLDFAVRYRDRNNEIVESDQIDARIDVDPKRDTFAVAPINATLQPGGSGALELRVTNQGDETLTDVSAKLFTDDPLDSDDDEAFIQSLAPGDSETVVFDVSAGGSALAKTYPASVDFQYDDADGDTHVSKTYRVPVQVEASQSEEDGSVSPLLLVGVLVVLLAAGFLGYRRYRG